MQGPPPGYSPPGTALPVPDAFVADLATGMLRQSGENYFQKGQAFVQSKMGFLSSSMLQYHFNISGENGAHRANPPCSTEPPVQMTLAVVQSCRSC